MSDFPGSNATKDWLKRYARGYLTIECGDWTYGRPAVHLAPDDLPRRLSIGRYCSIGEEVIIFLGRHGPHLTDELTTYPLRMAVTRDVLHSPASGHAEQYWRSVQGDLGVTIGDDVWIGTRAIIMAGVTIGTGAVIGAGAVVTDDILPYAVAVGVPAKTIRFRHDDEMIRRLLLSEWWKLEPDQIWQRAGEHMGQGTLSSVLDRLEGFAKETDSEASLRQDLSKAPQVLSHLSLTELTKQLTRGVGGILPRWPSRKDQLKYTGGEASRMLPRKNLATLESSYLYLLPFVLLAPSLVWILLDTSAWGGDQSQYGFATLELFHTLTTVPHEWPARMLDVFGYKPNGLIWLGQIFLPLAFFISSIDVPLLFTTIALQAVTLILVYRSVRVLTRGTFVVPTTACLVVASAPLFISFAHYYLVENLQTASVAWFVLIMSLAPTWNRSLLLAQLTAATAVALAAKEIQPLFCVWPGLVACIYWLRSPRRSEVSRAQKRLTIVSWVLAIPMVALTAAWYFHNRAAVYGHLQEGTYGQGVKTLWGKEDTYLNTLAYWLQTAREVNFLPGLAELSLLVAVSAVALYAARVKRAPTHFSLCAGVAALQIVTVVMVFSLSPTRQYRYLLPALPYVALIIGWSLAQINRGWVTALGFAAFAVQFVLLHGQGLNLLPVVSPLVLPVQQLADTGRVLDSLVARTCPESGPRPIWNIIAIEPSLPEIRGDWLAPEPANYVVARQRFRRGGALPCHYGYFGEGFFGSEVSQAWDSMLARQTQYVVVVDPAKYSTPPHVFNQALSRENSPRVLRKLETSELFTQEPRLAENTGILIFHRVEGALTLFDRIKRGRALLDRGLHEQAVADLQEATVLGPSNVEAWANLAFAYERAGRFQEAISAGVRARQLSPRHYYVNLNLARVSFQVGEWRDVVSYAREAASDAPGTADQANAWALAARGAFRSGDSQLGCGFLRRAGLATNDRRVPEASSHTCDK